jgi:hypothetical protein
MHLLAQVRENRQRHELEHVSRLGERSDGLHARRSSSLARDVATGSLLTRATQKQRLRFIPVPGVKNYGYGLALFKLNGWIGHSGLIPGYETLSVYLPSQQATLVVLINAHTTGLPLFPLAKTITKIITPKHIYSAMPAGVSELQNLGASRRLNRTR